MGNVSCLCRVDVLLKLGKVRFQVRFRRDSLVNGVINLGREALGEFALDAGTLEGAGQSASRSLADSWPAMTFGTGYRRTIAVLPLVIRGPCAILALIRTSCGAP